jgi:hypothetical protein
MRSYEKEFLEVSFRKRYLTINIEEIEKGMNRRIGKREEIT